MGSSLLIMSRMVFPAVLLLAAPLVIATPLASEDLQPANKSSNSWACPEYGLDFYGNDITYYEDIPTWQECGRLCYVHKFCSHWSWAHPRSDHPRRCFLKNGDGGARNDGSLISGEESCKTC